MGVNSRMILTFPLRYRGIHIVHITVKNNTYEIIFTPYTNCLHFNFRM